ncbi:hypothetical protein BO86DRAFT_399284 [Aspergillus japonicus CBS 114.51]|uniref:Uncharacterized protein n=1 Tax=Aspergillus japonicus CBS 114.51 TaxID=1448312 RepID=A0A8T8X3E7_ASPJA|nr:hypothetical protein BO86DRAFT_399284 [Aspergillus japonicus CBS 114.51]RAH82039.1 hypothetical protein BO86DRAFT_399284 [Aspergillus japonicus CBS 114.51]
MRSAGWSGSMCPASPSQGTLSLLQSAEHKPMLQAVGVTSSLACCVGSPPGFAARPGYVYTAAHWSPITYETADGNPELDLDLAQFPQWYRPLCDLRRIQEVAEQAAWRWYEEHQPAWQLAGINPGHILRAVRASSVSVIAFVADLVLDSRPGQSSLPAIDFPHWVDMHDVARAHLLALTTPQARGHRFILAPWKVPYSSFTEIVLERLSLQPTDQPQLLPGISQGRVPVQNGIITAVADQAEMQPPNASTIVHRAAAAVLAFGVTTVCNTHLETRFVPELRRAAAEDPDAADFRTASQAATIAGGGGLAEYTRQ